MPENVAAKTKKEQKNPKSKFQTECSSKKEKEKKKYLPAGEKICRRQSWTGMRSAGRRRTPDAERERRREGRTPRENGEERKTESGGAGAGERELWRGSAGAGRGRHGRRTTGATGDGRWTDEDDGRPSLAEWEPPERGNTPERERELERICLPEGEDTDDGRRGRPATGDGASCTDRNLRER